MKIALTFLCVVGLAVTYSNATAGETNSKK